MFGLVSFAFQSGCPAGIACFSLLVGMDCLFLRLRWVLQCSFVGFALTANGAFIFADTGVGYVFRHRFILYGIPVFLQFQPHERIFCEIFAPGNIGEMGLHHTILLKWRGQR